MLKLYTLRLAKVFGRYGSEISQGKTRLGGEREEMRMARVFEESMLDLLTART